MGGWCIIRVLHIVQIPDSWGLWSFSVLALYFLVRCSFEARKLKFWCCTIYLNFPPLIATIISKKSLLNSTLQRVKPVFSNILQFWPLNLWCIWVLTRMCVFWGGVWLHSFWKNHCLSAICWQDDFPAWAGLDPCSWISWLSGAALPGALLSSVPLCCVCDCRPVPPWLDYYKFEIQVYVQIFQLCSFSRLSILGSLKFHMNSKMCLSMSS